MLRVGLTGGLGSGKSTVAAMLRDRGAHVLIADAIARDLMQPGEPVYAALVARFGNAILQSSASAAAGAGAELDRAALARLAFAGGRVEELNAIIHPAVIARQAELAAGIAARDPAAVVVVESALLFETRHAGPQGWRKRFDVILLVTAPEPARIARFVDRAARSGDSLPDRAALAEEARRRIGHQLPDADKAAQSDFVLHNDGDLRQLRHSVDALWPRLLERTPPPSRQRSSR